MKMIIDPTRLKMSKISEKAFSTFGIENFAYIKPIDIDGQELFAIYAADGTHLINLDHKDKAYAVIWQNDLEPQSVH